MSCHQSDAYRQSFTISNKSAAKLWANTRFTMQDFVHLIASLEEEIGPIWEFYEPDATLEDVARSTVPGRLLTHLLEDYSANAVGLLIAYTSRRSLAAWFEYCVDVSPLRISNRLINYWLGGQIDEIDKAWTKEIPPTENGQLIQDCRWYDTSSASSSVAHAAKFARTRDLLDAIVSLSHANVTFESSPIGSSDVFRNWLGRYAIPDAISIRPMSYSDSVALADYRIPEAMRSQA